MGVAGSCECGRSLLSEGGLSTTKHRLDSFVFPWCRIRAVFGVQRLCDLAPLFPPQGEIVASSSALGHLTEFRFAEEKEPEPLRGASCQGLLLWREEDSRSRKGVCAGWDLWHRQVFGLARGVTLRTLHRGWTCRYPVVQCKSLDSDRWRFPSDF